MKSTGWSFLTGLALGAFAFPIVKEAYNVGLTVQILVYTGFWIAVVLALGPAGWPKKGNRK